MTDLRQPLFTELLWQVHVYGNGVLIGAGGVR
jgi:hypothetical protein